jgi:hypothetical protein
MSTLTKSLMKDPTYDGDEGNSVSRKLEFDDPVVLEVPKTMQLSFLQIAELAKGYRKLPGFPIMPIEMFPDQSL